MNGYVKAASPLEPPSVDADQAADGSRRALPRVSSLADETVCLETPADFRSVGQYYRHFPQIEDREVIELLKDA